MDLQIYALADTKGEASNLITEPIAPESGFLELGYGGI